METETQVQVQSKYIEGKVLIKETRPGFQDRIFMVRGLPREMLFGPDGKLHEGILNSLTGDDGYLFEDSNRESKDRLAILDSYIDSVHPKNLKKPIRIINAVRPGDLRSEPLDADKLEKESKSRLGYEFVDLPTEDVSAPNKIVTNSEYVAQSYKDKVESVPKPKKYYCKIPNCDYSTENWRGLNGHNLKHKRGKLDGPSNNP